MQSTSVRSRTVVVAAAMLLGGVLWAQEKPAQQQAGPVPLNQGTEVLSDTQGIDFAPYMRRLHDEIARNWDPLIPEEVNPPLSKSGVVSVRFTILPDGTIGEMKLERSSRDALMDKAAWYAVSSEKQFPPLPRAFTGPALELRIIFYYNSPVSQPKPEPGAEQKAAP